MYSVLDKKCRWIIEQRLFLWCIGWAGGSAGSKSWFDHHYWNIIYIFIVSCDIALSREVGRLGRVAWDEGGKEEG